MQSRLVWTFFSLVVCGANVQSYLAELDWIKPYSLIEEDYDLADYPSLPASEPLVHWSRSGVVTSTGRNYTIHVGSLLMNIPNSFSFQLSREGMSGTISVYFDFSSTSCMCFYNESPQCCRA